MLPDGASSLPRSQAQFDRCVTQCYDVRSNDMEKMQTCMSKCASEQIARLPQAFAHCKR